MQNRDPEKEAERCPPIRSGQPPVHFDIAGNDTVPEDHCRSSGCGFAFMESAFLRLSNRAAPVVL